MQVGAPWRSWPSFQEQTLVLKNGQRKSTNETVISSFFWPCVVGLVSSNSPTRPYAGHQKSPVATNYNALGASQRSPNVDELSSAMRSMVVEDDHNLQRQATLNLSRNFPSANQMIYSSIPRLDCTSSYQNSRDTLFDYSFSYDPCRPNSDPPAYSSSTGISGSPALIYPSISLSDPYCQSGYTYEFLANPRRPVPQYNQAMAYGHTGTSPCATSQAIQLSSLPVVDKINVQASCLNEWKHIVLSCLLVPDKSSHYHVDPYGTKYSIPQWPIWLDYRSSGFFYKIPLSTVRSDLFKRYINPS